MEETNVKDPAKALFDGLGSYGNGGAMRIAPMSLFLYNNYDRLLQYTKEVTEITHTNKLGINGAILQVITDGFFTPVQIYFVYVSSDMLIVRLSWYLYQLPPYINTDRCMYI